MSGLVVIGVYAMWLGGLASSVYLVMNDHPWFAFLVLVVSSSASYKRGRKS